MNKGFLSILKEKLSDPKYGWYAPTIDEIVIGTLLDMANEEIERQEKFEAMIDNKAKKLKTFPDEEALFKMNQAQEMAKGQWSVKPMPAPPRGCYGNEDCQREWWSKEYKNL